MTEIRMSLSAPLIRGWDRMVTMLFRPFDAGKWLVVGFSAWLAGLADGGFAGGASGDSGDDGVDVAAGARAGWEWLTAHELVAGLIAGAVLAVIALLVIVLWVSSRAKFIFLDNVVHNRAEIAGPWTRFRELGNSLFAFRIVAALIVIPIVLAVIGVCFWLAAGPGGWARLEGAAVAAGIVATLIVGCLVALTGLFAVFFLDAFVVPLMHRHDLRVMAAWRRFFELARGRFGWFLLSGVLVFVLCLVAFSAILVTGFMTCCLGFLLLAIPYVGTVVLLPLIVAYRAFTVEFLAQVDPELLVAEPEEQV